MNLSYWLQIILNVFLATKPYNFSIHIFQACRSHFVVTPSPQNSSKLFYSGNYHWVSTVQGVDLEGYNIKRHILTIQNYYIWLHSSMMLWEKALQGKVGAQRMEKSKLPPVNFVWIYPHEDFKVRRRQPGNLSWGPSSPTAFWWGGPFSRTQWRQAFALFPFELRVWLYLKFHSKQSLLLSIWTVKKKYLKENSSGLRAAWHRNF